MIEPSDPGNPDSLRRRAEDALCQSKADIEKLPVKDLHALVHELQVHQIELKMQNEELRETQLKLQQSRDSYTELYEFAPVGYLTLDGDGVIRKANLTASTLFGRGIAALIGTKIAKYVDAEDADNLHRAFWSITASKERRRFELRFTNHGQPLFAHVEASMRESKQDEWLVTLTDISDRKRAEEELERLNQTLEERVAERAAALHESIERMAAILMAAADAIITIDAEGLIISVNPVTEEMYGYAEDELVGQNVNVLMPSPYHEEHHGYLERYHRTHQSRVIGHTLEMLGLRKDGTTFPVELSVSKVDHLEMFTGIHRDISERRELQTAVLNIAAEEGRRIGQELHDGVGQELTGLSMFAGTLAQGLKDVQARNPRLGDEQVEPTFNQLTDIAVRLVNGIDESNKHVHELCHGVMPVHVDAEGLRAALEELAIATNQHLSCIFQCQSGFEASDNAMANQLFRIAQEAVTNALKHSQADKLVISLRHEDRKLILSVIDNGIGIDIANGIEGLGLRIMQYRAGLIGATLTVNRREKSGTQVTCTVLPTRKPSC